MHRVQTTGAQIFAQIETGKKLKKKFKNQQLKYTVIVFDPKYPCEIEIQFYTIEWYMGSYT